MQRVTAPEWTPATHTHPARTRWTKYGREAHLRVVHKVDAPADEATAGWLHKRLHQKAATR